MKDEIIQEVWLGKDAVAAKYKHDATVMAKALRDREKGSSAKVINLHARHQTISRTTK